MNVFRRRFLQTVGFSTSAAVLTAKPNNEGKQTVAWRVAGFTCVTCAVGLETLLKRQPGVVEVHAKYPEGTVRIEYDAAKLSARELKEAIEEMGFRVEPGA